MIASTTPVLSYLPPVSLAPEGPIPHARQARDDGVHAHKGDISCDKQSVGVRKRSLRIKWWAEDPGRKDK